MKKILITLGDPNGIGSEVTIKALSALPEVRPYVEVIGLDCVWNDAFPEILFHPISSDYIPELGVMSPKAGQVAIQSLDKAIELLKTDNYSGLVTAPISKEAIVQAGIQNFSGHTEYLAEAFEREVEMIFWSERWSVLLMTIHVALSEVPKLITKDRLRSSLRNAILFQEKLYQKGQIALSGLNPHAGENGLFGQEEELIFKPVIKEFSHYNIIGPLSPDTIFMQAEQGAFNMVVSPYHDQALIAFKLLHFHDGVNVTMGLPYWRSSPDHGTAFELAGKNQASPDGMICAIKFMQKMFN
ncbi:MAG: PdxA family dehydrogenase [Brevinema sp.]